MYYSSFRIRNFKGIKDTTVTLAEQSKAGVFAFVGLNESGKTTILEAIHSFSPDSATGELVGSEGKSGVPFRERVPRHLISNFTDDVSVTATVRISAEEKKDIIQSLKREPQLIVDPDSFPDEVTIERQQRFNGGDFVASYFSLRTPMQIKTGKQKKWRAPNKEEREQIRDEIYNRTPILRIFRPLFSISRIKYF
uniref:AAA domain-containing protein n=1 Tax=Candidatus Kentrum sp. LPFa TaxID=2126335 RepID=A0A450WQ47_9GAMM|nr:MAG: AAA domain-containing protein [Candidatus Kentron sp. LPFa]